MTTGQDLIEKTRRHLMGGFGEMRSTLSTNYTAASGTLVLSTAPIGLLPGSRLSSGLNIFYVSAVVGGTCTVLGGQEGSTDVNATVGALVRVNPKFTDFEIWGALNDDINALSSEGLFTMAGVNLTYNATLTGYDLGATAAANLLNVYEVKFLTPGPYKDMPHMKSYEWRLDRNNVTTDIASGLAIRLLNPGNLTNGYTFTVVYRSMLQTLVNVTDDLSITGLQVSAYDLPPMGAAITVMAGREIRRDFTDVQGDSRRALEVPAGAVTASTVGLSRLRVQRLTLEVAKLRRMYPQVID